MIYATSVGRTVDFYEKLGFVRQYQWPMEGTPGYVSLRRDLSDVAVVDREWPLNQYGIAAGNVPTSEMFVYVEDPDRTVSSLEDAGVVVVRHPEDMPWGERVGCVLDPDGNPVSLARS
jgi:lactoylglutathione lyase